MDGKILVVEDEKEIRDLIIVNLQRAGYRALSATSVKEADAVLREELPSLVVLDWVLPETPGVLFARRLRTDPRTAGIPIIMLTGRVREEDRIMGLEAGVDDYVTKPFFPRELLARIRAVIRRCKPQLTDEAVELAGVMLNPAARLITCNGQEVELCDIEFRMLHFFMTHPERVYSRAQLLDEVWGDRVFVEERTVDVHIRRLRQALEPAKLEELLETVRGVGYRFRRSLPVPARVPAREEQALPQAAA